jgi:broad specificity phosphatase PhoE
MRKDIMTMRHTTIGFLVALAFALLAAMPSADAQQVVFLMRHAEQASGADADDPPLTETGQHRAKALVTVLKDAGLTAIYTSEAQRTNQTAAPLAQALQIEPKSMPRRDIDGLLERLRTQHADGRVLIISHSLIIAICSRPLGILRKSLSRGRSTTASS